MACKEKTSSALIEIERCSTHFFPSEEYEIEKKAYEKRRKPLTEEQASFLKSLPPNAHVLWVSPFADIEASCPAQKTVLRSDEVGATWAEITTDANFVEKNEISPVDVIVAESQEQAEDFVMFLKNKTGFLIYPGGMKKIAPDRCEKCGAFISGSTRECKNPRCAARNNYREGEYVLTKSGHVFCFSGKHGLRAIENPSSEQRRKAECDSLVRVILTSKEKRKISQQLLEIKSEQISDPSLKKKYKEILKVRFPLDEAIEKLDQIADLTERARIAAGISMSETGQIDTGRVAHLLRCEPADAALALLSVQENPEKNDIEIIWPEIFSGIHPSDSWLPKEVVKAFAQTKWNITTDRLTFDEEVERWFYDGEMNEENRRMLSILNGDNISPEISRAFVHFFQKNDDWRTLIEQAYMDNFFSFPAENITKTDIFLPYLGGDMPELYPHQRRVIWRLLSQNNLLLSHMVGAGKTFSMIGASLMLLQTGKIRKPMHVVQNNMVEQYARDFQRMFPASCLLVLSASDFSPSKIQQTMEQISTGAWDAVILSHENFEKIPVSSATEASAQKQWYEKVKRAYEKHPSDEWAKKEMQKSLESLQAALSYHARQNETPFLWENLGVDCVFVDESDRYKNLDPDEQDTAQGKERINESRRAKDMYYRLKQMREMRPESVIVFASGTPASNSMLSETYNVLKYMQSSMSYKDFMSRYARTELVMEPTTTGEYRYVRRVTGLKNAPSFRALIRRYADIEMDPVRLGLRLPRLKNSRRTIISIQPSEKEKQLITKSLSEKKSGLEQFSALRNASIDVRLLDPSYPDFPDSKVNTTVKMLVDYRRTSPDKTQLVFCDVGISGGNTFDLYKDIRQKLLQSGAFSPQEIAFMQDYKTKEEKIHLYDAFNRGEIKVLIASTQTAGAGANIQKKLGRLYHLSTPLRPRDIMQREGRILRAGNENDEVEIIQPVSTGTIDEYIWNLLERKRNAFEQIYGQNTDNQNELDDIDSIESDFRSIQAAASRNAESMHLWQRASEELKEKRKNYLRLWREAAKLKESLSHIRNQKVWYGTLLLAFGKEQLSALKDEDLLRAWYACKQTGHATLLSSFAGTSSLRKNGSSIDLIFEPRTDSLKALLASGGKIVSKVRRPSDIKKIFSSPEFERCDEEKKESLFSLLKQAEIEFSEAYERVRKIESEVMRNRTEGSF